MSTPLRVYHYPRNFGDVIIRFLFNAYGIPMEPVTTQTQQFDAEHVDFVGIGSIMSQVPKEFRGIIWSTGCIRVDNFEIPHARVWGVRGRLTYKALPKNKRLFAVLGDGAILTRKAMQRKGLTKNVEKMHVLGIVPHYVDYEIVRSFSIAKMPGVVVIDVFRNPGLILKKLIRCKHILSSSLHGLIVADSLRIPNARFVVETSSHILGGDFKFRDYYSAFGEKYTSLGTQKMELTAETTLDDILPQTTLRIPEKTYRIVERKLEKRFLQLKKI
jgi:pyruvyltransferase